MERAWVQLLRATDYLIPPTYWSVLTRIANISLIPEAHKANPFEVYALRSE